MSWGYGNFVGGFGGEVWMIGGGVNEVYVGWEWWVFCKFFGVFSGWWVLLKKCIVFGKVWKFKREFFCLGSCFWFDMEVVVLDFFRRRGSV